MPHTKRRALRIINKKLQSRIILIISLSVGITSTSATILAWILMHNNYSKIIKEMAYLVPNLSNKLYLEQFTMNTFFIVIIFASIILSIFLGLWISHKIAGPLFAFTRAINKLTRGVDDGFKLRENDELKDLEILYDDIKKLVSESKK